MEHKHWQLYPRIKRLRDVETIKRTANEDMEPWFMRVDKQREYAGFHTMSKTQSNALYTVRNSEDSKYKGKCFEFVEEDITLLTKDNMLCIWCKMKSSQVAAETNNQQKNNVTNKNSKGVTVGAVENQKCRRCKKVHEGICKNYTCTWCTANNRSERQIHSHNIERCKAKPRENQPQAATVPTASTTTTANTTAECTVSSSNIQTSMDPV